MALALASLLVAGACGYWPPVVDSREDIYWLPPKEVDLRTRGLPDADILALAHLRALEDLDFTGGWGVQEARLTDKGLETLASLDLPNLKRLSLGYNRNITDAGLAHVARMSQVRYLHLEVVHEITDQGLLHLTRMPELRLLDLRGCTNLTDDGIRVLADK